MEWRIVFWIAFGVFMVTNAVYIIWASGEVQPWNTPHLMNKPLVSSELDGKDNKGFEDKEKDKNSTTVSH
jgi:ACS family sodium-dependent inorganic phosphate cotransporter